MFKNGSPFKKNVKKPKKKIKKYTLRVHVEKCSRIKAKPTYLPSVTKGLTCKSLQEMYVGTTYNLQTTLS